MALLLEAVRQAVGRGLELPEGVEQRVAVGERLPPPPAPAPPPRPSPGPLLGEWEALGEGLRVLPPPCWAPAGGLLVGERGGEGLALGLPTPAVSVALGETAGVPVEKPPAPLLPLGLREAEAETEGLGEGLVSRDSVPPPARVALPWLLPVATTSREAVPPPLPLR